MTDPLRELVLPRLDGVRKTGGGFEARCPAHEDRKASMSVGPGRDRPVVFHCHVGCPPDDILAKIGLTWADLSEPRDERDSGEWTPAGPAIAVYDYTDEDRNLLFQVLRTMTKDFRQRVPDPAGKNGWTWKLGDVRRVIYRLPDIITAVREGREVYICEGEKDVHTLVHRGLEATCNPGGAGKWRPEYVEFFKEAVVTIVADRDDPGRAHARAVCDALLPVAAVVTVVEAAEGKDATDHVNAGYGLHELVVTFTSEQVAKSELAPDLWEFLAQPDDPYDWIVPDLLERGDRLILTGYEGLGKSMLTRQMAVMMAAGMDPFHWHRSIKPVRVLYIDCENSIRQSRRRYRPLATASEAYEARVPDGGLRLIHRPEGIDLTKDEWARWLMERVTAHKPDVLFVGPFYRLHHANANEELPARKAVAVLDAVRTAVDCALITEAHAGHGDPSSGSVRALRPAGSSLFMRWPEFGFGIRPAGKRKLNGRPRDVEFVPWRGPRDDRNWPRYLTMGDPTDWPWKVALGVPDEDTQ